MRAPFNPIDAAEATSVYRCRGCGDPLFADPYGDGDFNWVDAFDSDECDADGWEHHEPNFDRPVTDIERRT